VRRRKDGPRGGLRGFFICRGENSLLRTDNGYSEATTGHGMPCPYEESEREGEDYEIALAGEDYGQEAAVGRDVEFAD